MNDILSKFRDVLDIKMNVFFEKASKQFSIDKEKLIAVWNDQMLQPDEKLPVLKSKKSFYQIFFSSKRIELKEKDPSLNFGELSKKISKLWNSMSKQEQNEWIKQNHTAVDADTNYKNIKVSDLRSLCVEKGVSSKGNRMDLIQSLANKKKMPQEDESLHISEGVLHQKRASIEIPIENDQEEEDFIFDDNEEEDNDEDSLVEGVEEEDEDFEGDEEI